MVNEGAVGVSVAEDRPVDSGHGALVSEVDFRNQIAVDGNRVKSAAAGVGLGPCRFHDHEY